MAEGGGAANTGGGTPTVFISYASQDAAVADAVVAALERCGVRCWVAPRDVVPGEFYARAIVHAIDATRATVLVLSENAVGSQHVLREVERASSRRHPVVSFRVDLAPMPADLEYFLNTSHWLDASSTGVDRALPKLVDAVQRAVASASSGGPTATSGSMGAALPSAPRPPAARTSTPRLSRTVIAAGTIIAVGLVYFTVDRFRFTKHVAEQRPAAATAPAAMVSAPVTPAVSVKSVAVLPFVDMSETKDQEYFSDGMAEEIIDLLVKIPELTVPARTSSFYFKGKSEDIPTIAKRLLVAHVLEGSVRRSGSRLRVTVQLVRADNGYHLWSETYDRQLDDVFKVQDEIAAAVVAALKVSLLTPNSARSAPTASTEAYTAYLQGRSIFLRGSTAAEMEKAADYLHRALKLDPEFAPAWAELSFVRLWQVWEFPVEGAAEEARHAAEQALAVDPMLAEAHLAAGRVRETLDWDWAGADKELRRALELSPTNARVLRSSADIPLVRAEFDKALPLYLRAKAQDPLDDVTLSELGWMYYYLGRFAEAEAIYREALDLNPGSAGSVVGAHWELAMTLLARGEQLAALTEMQRESSVTRANQGFAIIYHAIGRETESDAAMVAAEREYARHAAPKYWDSGAVWIACAHAYRGEANQALAWLERAYERRDFGLVYLKGSPLLRNVEGDPHYKALLRKMNLPE